MQTLSNCLQLAESLLLEPTGLTIADLNSVIGKIFTYKIDYADLYFQHTETESWILEDGIVKDANFSIAHGVGVRAIAGEQTGFAYSDDLSRKSLENAAAAARNIASIGGTNGIATMSSNNNIQVLYPAINPIHSIDNAKKIAMLQYVNSIARKASPLVTQVIAGISMVHDTVLIYASDGTYAADVRPLVRFNVTVTVTKNGCSEQAVCGGGGRDEIGQLLPENKLQEFTVEAVRQALVRLEAVAAPAGTMPVVLGPGWPGILLHEAIGHGLEGDFNRKKSSAFSDRIGEKVASSLCTVVDDGTLANRRGSLTIDDEGTKTQCTTLIENGILKGYMQDKLNAKLMGTISTGNGRRESYAHLPMPRMTNTYMLPGKHDPAEIISSVAKGIYAVNFSGGQVDITSGKFVFNASEAYLIENGKVTLPVKGAMLIGDGPDVLTKVSMVGDDLKLDTGIGTCGKDGQSVPVGVGQPTIKIDLVTVGGTKC
ncbi:MAG: metalloprotease TldD [Legionellales bacterium]|nr:MAG: metalloprotease TldD [Legionellales bacterium]